MPVNRALYLPILVGAVYNYAPGIDYQRDDDGENISGKNPNYNELTAIYWAWKNLKNADVIGLVHYRRYFFKKRSRDIKDILSLEDIQKLLVKNDVILPFKRHYYIETNYSHYVHAHESLPLLETRKIIENMYPEYLNSFDLVMGRRSAHMFNMFIMKRPVFNKYCEWLFGVLGALEKRIDISNFSKQEARVFGYISELLMDVWIQKNNPSYSECRWEQLGKRKIISKMFFFIVRKIGFRRGRTHF
ncbi:capsular biosynthesis protein [Levilactobacillus namurensis DSM 19117]|uniref:Capsular biosynthesis protein n=2 Tax=Levilactobacillus namurensis TaxID=380393 RepID=A0A0R1JN98_9LACO|nr:capsular biosynthesis protein [Levilactobacillus namurensis DSM 19117]GEO75046.1 multidrug MFS transporter [Levilactobacillus namurensis]